MTLHTAANELIDILTHEAKTEHEAFVYLARRDQVEAKLHDLLADEPGQAYRVYGRGMSILRTRDGVVVVRSHTIVEPDAIAKLGGGW